MSQSRSRCMDSRGGLGGQGASPRHWRHCDGGQRVLRAEGAVGRGIVFFPQPLVVAFFLLFSVVSPTAASFRVSAQIVSGVVRGFLW